MILLIFHRTILTEVGKIAIVDRNVSGRTRKPFDFSFVYPIIYLVIQYVLFMTFPSSNSS